MVQSHFKLDIFEIILFVWDSILINDRLVILETASRVNPAVGVSRNIFFKLNEHANLGKGVIFVAHVL